MKNPRLINVNDIFVWILQTAEGQKLEEDETPTAEIVDRLSQDGSPPPGEGEELDHTSPPVPGTPDQGELNNQLDS